MRKATLAAIFALTVGGCSVGPDYIPPAPEVPARWNAAADAGLDDATPELRQWWARFEDPTLSALVERALSDNIELHIAEERVREARALRGVTAADRYPGLDANGVAAPAWGEMTSLFLAGLDAFWEIDVFGGVRRSVEAADADVDASIEAQRATRLAVLGDVAATYIELRGFQARIATVRSNLAGQEETWALTRAQLQVGLASDLDVQRARALVAATASELPLLETAREASVHRLGVLLGRPPAALATELSTDAPIPSAPRALLLGVPADLLRRRPDLRRAERQLAAATARIGEAKADLYPRFTLTGSVGLRSDDVKDLLNGKGGFGVVGPNVIWPIFAGGRILANVEAQDARQAQAAARYELVLLEALEQVENALVRYAREQVRRSTLAEAVDANREAAELARRLHANGLSAFLDVLVAERSLLEAEDRLVASEAAVSTSLVALYVALGGGWESAVEVPL